MKKFLIFMLGMLFGIIFVFAALAGGIYIALTVVRPSDVLPDSPNYIGDFANMSIMDMAKSISDLYKSKIGVADGDHYYTLGEFMEQYHIDSEKAFGVKLPQEVLDVPAFEFFNSDNGVTNAMKQIKVSSLPALMNMFSSSEDGSAFSDEVIAEFSKHSLFDLLQDENIGIAGVFENIKFADMLLGVFPSQDTDNKLMWAVGQTSIGKLLKGVSGADNILSELNAGGAFEMLGQLQITEIAGSNEMIQAIAGDLKICDIVDENGNVNLDKIMDGISLGEMLGLTRKEVAEIDGYTTLISETVGEGEEAREVSVVLYKESNGGREYIMLKDDKYFIAELDCDSEETSHQHGKECFKTVWYDANGNEANGVYSVIANLTVAELTSGDQDSLMQKLYQVPISDFIDENNDNALMQAVSHLTVGELIGGQLDEIYLGSFFGYRQKGVDETDIDKNYIRHLAKNENNSEILTIYITTKISDNGIILSDDGKTWYEGEIICKKDGCAHAYADCYGYVWYIDVTIGTKPDKGVQAALANQKIGYLNNLNGYIMEMTLHEVLGDNIPAVLQGIKDTKIGELENAIDNMYLGELLGYEKVGDKWLDTNGQEITGAIAKIADKKVNELNSLNETVQSLTLREVMTDIPAALNSIADTPIGELGTAIDGMYLGEFLKFNKADGVWTDESGNPVTGALSHIVGITVGNLNSDTITDAINGMTLGEVLGEQDNGILKELSNVKISELGNRINDIYLGSAMGYSRKEIADNGSYVNIVDNTVKGDDNGNFIKIDGTVWYEAELSCTVEHTHTTDCYGYVWYDGQTAVEGVTKVFVNNKISDDISLTVNNLTLRKLGIRGNTILDQLQDTKITEIGDAISDMSLGTVMGYKKIGGIWYTHNCGNTDESHEHIDGCFKQEVTGLNAKMSDMTMAGFSSGNGLTNVVATLTVKDLIDSGMMSLGDTEEKAEENSYKFAIIYCGNSAHNCSLQGYIVANQMTNQSAKDYWLKAHGVTSENELTEEQTAHRDYWQNQQLSSFIQTLLDAI